MNFLMIMGLIGLFTLSITAAPMRGSSDGINAPGASQQRTLQQQIQDIEMFHLKLQERQNDLIFEQTKYNCRLGAIEAKPSTHFQLIEGPDGLYMRKDGKLHLIERKKNISPVAEIFEEPVNEDLAAISHMVDKKVELENPDHNKIKESDIFIETSMKPEDLKRAAAKASQEAEIAKAKVIKSINDGNEQIENMECTDSTNRGCTTRLDNHIPMPQENLKKYTFIDDEDVKDGLNTDKLDIEYQRSINTMGYSL